MEPMTAGDFAAAVHAAVEGVRHLYRELNRLNLALVEALEAEPSSLSSLLGRGKAEKEGRTTVRDWYGQLFRSADLEDEDLAEDDDDAEDDAEDDSTKDGVLVTLDPDQPLLGVKLIVYDAPRGAEFQPQIAYAVLRDWGIGKAGQKIDAPFEVKRAMLKKLPRSIDTGGEPKRIVSAVRVGKGGKKGDRRLSFKVAGAVQSKPLFDLSGPDSVLSLAAAMKEHWLQHLEGPPSR